MQYFPPNYNKITLEKAEAEVCKQMEKEYMSYYLDDTIPNDLYKSWIKDSLYCSTICIALPENHPCGTIQIPEIVGKGTKGLGTVSYSISKTDHVSEDGTIHKVAKSYYPNYKGCHSIETHVKCLIGFFKKYHNGIDDITLERLNAEKKQLDKEHKIVFGLAKEA